ncbi:MAG: peroxiredoxin [Candidatus Methanomethylophilaceae archaeon]|nr:peroxiredoxin [Candidatus Methanomethylophilaceae archaeon]MDD2778605.1 peroxiredoxin [Candidatus Methanomethylophilaceae archaeon]MDD3128036.1 peroxiredoxin [Candidatus Methanomethylophilaceae archaeon]MDD4119502.1 peroxiredoxin [Candidatus Methanomethylophilaceae archaeon]MDD4454116.1 peroxiredoxin [Candidatus Methanomethylophilaceae archaeon]
MDIGERFPAFILSDENGQTFDSAMLEGVTFVLYFYPRDNTPGCTKEALGFNDIYKKLMVRNIPIIGVSKDSPESHRKFADKNGLRFKLLSDPELRLIKAAGAWGKKMMYGKETEGTVRSTYIVGKDGKVEAVWPKVRVEGHADEVYAKIKQLVG